MSVGELYEHSIKPLSAAERYELATLILSEIPPQAVVDLRDDWNEEDLQDASRASLEHIGRRLESEE